MQWIGALDHPGRFLCAHHPQHALHRLLPHLLNLRMWIRFGFLPNQSAQTRASLVHPAVKQDPGHVPAAPRVFVLVGGGHVPCFSAGLAEQRQVLGPCEALPQIAHRVRAGGEHALQLAAILPCAAQRARKQVQGKRGGDVRVSEASKKWGSEKIAPFAALVFLPCSCHEMCVIPSLTWV